MKTSARLLPLLVLPLLSWACSARQTSYAEAYRSALERYQGTAEITPAMTRRFVDFFSRESGDSSPPPDPSDLYGEPLYFSDTLLTTEDRDAALSHLRRMHEASRSLNVTVLDQQIDGQDAYLVWQMQATFQPLAAPVTSNSLGVTHLRFDGEGRIILQQDFWDSAEGLYRHVPVLGGLIGALRGRFQRVAE